MALEDQGRDAVLERVGVEPSGNPFNSIVVDDRNRPFNPMVNAGAIVATGLIEARDDDDRDGPHRRRPSRGTRAAACELDETVYRSESATGDRNRAIAYLMRSFGMLRGDVDAVIDAYFRQCSLLVTCRDLATMAATLANRGTNPITGERALDPRYVENVLSVMSTCGMYDYAGEWVYTVGLPAKSGVAGGVVAVLPGQLGIGVFSPPLDARGNSARGIQVCQRMAADFDLHPLRFQPEVRDVVRRSYRCSQTRSNRVRTPDEYDVLASHARVDRRVRAPGRPVLRIDRAAVPQRRRGSRVASKRSCSTASGSVTSTAPRSPCSSNLRVRARRHRVRAGRGRDGPTDVLEDVAARSFPDADGALEWCENRILPRSGAPPSRCPKILGSRSCSAD